jgi:hypothetical protein
MLNHVRHKLSPAIYMKDIFHMASTSGDRRAAHRPLPPPHLSLDSASGGPCVRARMPHAVDAHRRPKNVAKELHVSSRHDW